MITYDLGIGFIISLYFFFVHFHFFNQPSLSLLFFNYLFLFLLYLGSCLGTHKGGIMTGALHRYIDFTNGHLIARDN
jgi:hypothetical protein